MKTVCRFAALAIMTVGTTFPLVGPPEADAAGACPARPTSSSWSWRTAPTTTSSEQSAPYINALASTGAVFTDSHAITHPSQPNYLALFSGATQGVKDDLTTEPSTILGILETGACMNDVATTQPLIGRRILVTGAATGIGTATARALTAAGAAVVATHHESPIPDGLESLTWLHCDARSKESVRDVVDGAVAAMGGLDVLIANAGGWRPSTPADLTEDELDLMFDMNVKSTVFSNQVAFEHMKDHGGGRIVNLGSSEGVRGNPLAPHYAIAKAAIHAWTRSAAGAWGAFGVTVNAVAPAVESRGAERYRENLGPDGAEMLSAQLQMMMPVRGALGDAFEDLGPLMVFLSSEGSRFITGQLIAVDGGLMMLGA
jgi:NAD(P)-dependent dehydrogenase (short-subunit alcohol dehydrogenase family)